MSTQDYQTMTLSSLRKYVLEHREDIRAFEIYVDRSQEEGRMTRVLSKEDGGIVLDLPAKKKREFHHPHEQDYWEESVELDFNNSPRMTVDAYLLRVYPERFNTYDAYLDIPTHLSGKPIPKDIVKIYSPRLNQTWIVTNGPTESPINGQFRGDISTNNPPVLMMGLQKEPIS